MNKEKCLILCENSASELLSMLDEFVQVSEVVVNMSKSYDSRKRCEKKIRLIKARIRSIEGAGFTRRCALYETL